MSRIADTPGVYRNFNGWIKFKNANCQVKNADFELLEEHKKYKGKIDIWIEFERGDVIKGELWYANIEHCNFRGTRIDKSVFRGGTFAGWEFIWSYWLGGEWESGNWGSYNYDKFGRRRIFPPPFDRFDNADGIITQPGRYKDFNGKIEYGSNEFYIKNGEIEIQDDIGKNIVVHGGVITKGDLKYATVNYVEFNGNAVYQCDWYDGIFNGIIFNDNYWHSGTWLGGKWHNSYWFGGFDKNGNYHKEFDEPSKWKKRNE